MEDEGFGLIKIVVLLLFSPLDGLYENEMKSL